MKKIVQALRAPGFGTYEFDPQTLEFSTAPEGAEPQSLIVPGFVDIHIHGAFGIDFMSASHAELIEWCEKLREVGYEGFLPTTVTAPPADVAAALSRLPEHPMIWGFHLEGPFISPKFPGAQPQSAIAAPPTGPSEWDPILEDPRLRVVTLAPELPGALALIRRLAARGVASSIGHTDATYAQCQAAFEAGARHATHTYNAMRPLHHREPGTVGFALGQDGLYTELIYDRHHVSYGAARILARCKRSDELVAISDGTMAAGLSDGTDLQMWGLKCRLQDGTVRLTDGTLAGSAITLLDAFRNLHEDFGPETAIAACCLNPRRALGADVERPNVYLEFENLNLVRRYER